MKSTINKIAILLVVTAAFTAAVRYQDKLVNAGDMVRSETIKVSKETFDAVAKESDAYKSLASKAAAAEAESTRLRKELEKAKEPMTTKVVAWFKR